MPDDSYGRNPLGRLDPNEVFDKLLKLGDEWAEANAAASFFEETQKSLLAQIAVRLHSGGGSFAGAEARARGSDEYQKHIRQMVLARRDANKKRVAYDSAKVWAELIRSANANRRAEMTLGGMQT